MLNDNIRSHNETRDALLSALQLPPIPPRPLYTSPYETSTFTTPGSTTTMTTTPTPPPPPPPSSSCPSDFDDSTHIITSTELSYALDAVSLPTIDSEFAALAEIVADLATPSGLAALSGTRPIGTTPEDAPIGTIRLVTSSGLAPVLTYSEVVTTSATVDTAVSSHIVVAPVLTSDPYQLRPQ